MATTQGLSPGDDTTVTAAAAAGPLVPPPPPRSSSREPPAVRAGPIDSGVTDNNNNNNNNSEKAEDTLKSRKRDGSRGSKRSAAQAHATGADTAPKPKKKGFLSFLACCGGSADADEPDSPDSVQMAKSNSRAQPSRSRVPQQAQNQNTSVTDTSAADSRDVIDEKSTYEGASRPAADENGAPLPSVPAEPASTQERQAEPYLNTTIVGPQVNVEAPTPVLAAAEEEIISDRTPEQAQRDTDIEMTDAGPSIPLSSAEVPPVPEDEHETAPAQTQAADNIHKVDLPPPPPLAERVAQTSASVAAAHGQDPSIAFSSEPGQKWLLPSIAPGMKGRKCLVLDLDETLVHSSFKILHQADFTIPVEIEGQYHNVYVIKRPGVDTFLKRVGEIYEVVVFTASVSKYGDPLLDQLDISGSVHHRLFRESCYNHRGNYVKDLGQVGRPLEETIIIDNSPTSYIFHPQNAVPISSWFSDAHDNELLDLIPVLEDLAGSQVRDVSLVLDVAL